MQSVCGSEFNRTQVIFKLVTIEPCSVLESVRVGREQVNLLSREIELSDQVIYWFSQLRWTTEHHGLFFILHTTGSPPLPHIVLSFSRRDLH